MAEESKPRKAGSGTMRNILTALLIAAAFAGAYYLGMRTRASRADGFAKCLAAKQVKMYGAFWCPHCADQKELFGASFQYVPYVECGIQGSRAEAPQCLQAGVKRFPTWQFPNGEQREGTLPLQMLSEKTGCSLR